MDIHVLLLVNDAIQRLEVAQKVKERVCLHFGLLLVMISGAELVAFIDALVQDVDVKELPESDQIVVAVDLLD